MYYTAEELGFTNEVRTIILYVEAVKENIVQYHNEGGWFEESDWSRVGENVKPTTTILVSNGQVKGFVGQS